MRTQLLTIYLLLIAASAFAEPSKEQLVGHWRYIGDNQTVDYTFKADDTFTGSITEDGKVVLRYAGKWSLDGDKLKYEFTSSTPEIIAAGTTDQDKITELTRDYYIIETQFYAKRQYSRVD